MTADTPVEKFPEFLPPAAKTLTEDASVAMAKQMHQAFVQTDLSDRPIATPYVCEGNGTPPILLLHGFDSSLLEFRRLVPHLASFRQTWAVDLLGFGLGDRTDINTLTPEDIKHHLYCFWEQNIQQPIVLVGASMGGAAAIDFALTYPNLVNRLVLLDSAGFAAGPAMGRFMFPPLDRWATGFLKSSGVRRRISLQAYHDKSFVTSDAEMCASLHLDCPRWAESLIAFTKSGGYNFLSQKIEHIAMPTLVVWGKQDKILGTQDATKFEAKIPDAILVWIDQCGHVPHLEKPEETAAAIQSWL